MDKVVFKGRGDRFGNYGPEINKALKECAGKSVLYIEKGVYPTGPIDIPSHTRLVLEEGAELSFIDDFSMYGPVETWWEGVPCWAMHPCFFISCAEDVVVEGSGVLRGNGKKWWDYILEWKNTGRVKGPETKEELLFASLNKGYEKMPSGGGGRPKQFLRPPLLQIYKSRNVIIRGITVTESPFWTVHPLLSDDLLIENVHVKNPYDSPNTDGIDIEMCQGVTVKGCIVDVGDDGIAVKSGSGALAKEEGRVAKDIFIEDCKVLFAHGGIVVGSETANGVDNICVKDCFFDGTDRGVRIKTRRGRGGKIRGIKISDITMNNVICPISINMYYRCGDPDPIAFSLDPQPIDDLTPEISDVSIKGLKVTNARASASFIVGLPESPIRNVTIEDCDIQLSDNIEEGLEIEMCRGIQMNNYRGIRVINSEVKVKNTRVNVEPAVSFE